MKLYQSTHSARSQLPPQKGGYSSPTDNSAAQAAIDEFESSLWPNPLMGGVCFGFSTKGDGVADGTCTAEVSPWEGMVSLDWIQAFPQGTGAGAAMLKKILEAAGNHNVPVTLSVDQTRSNQDRLKKWYSSFGFKPEGGGHRMVWHPAGASITSSATPVSPRVMHYENQPPTGVNPGEAIRELLSSPKWTGETPQEINYGLCDEFAWDLQRLVGGSFTELEYHHPNAGHFWVTLNGKAYDAETPQGADSWKELPYYRRLLTSSAAPAPSVNPIKNLRWVQDSWSAKRGDVLVEVDTKLLDNAWQKESDTGAYYLSPEGSNRIGDRYERVQAWLKDGATVTAPEVGFPYGHEDGAVGFTDGRHRFAALRDAGMQQVVVSMAPDDVPAAEEQLDGRVYSGGAT